MRWTRRWKQSLITEIPIFSPTRMTFQSHVFSVTQCVWKAVHNGAWWRSKKMIAAGCATVGSTPYTSGTAISAVIMTLIKSASQRNRRSNSLIQSDKSTLTRIWTIKTFQSYFQMIHTGSQGHSWPYLTSLIRLSQVMNLTMKKYLCKMLSKSLTLLTLDTSTPLKRVKSKNSWNNARKSFVRNMSKSDFWTQQELWKSICVTRDLIWSTLIRLPVNVMLTCGYSQYSWSLVNVTSWLGHRKTKTRLRILLRVIQ